MFPREGSLFMLCYVPVIRASSTSKMISTRKTVLKKRSQPMTQDRAQAQRPLKKG